MRKKVSRRTFKKRFIEVSRALYFPPILLAKKLGSSIRFCVDFKKLNALIKKDAYPIPLIAEMLVQLKNAKIFTKIDI